MFLIFRLSTVGQDKSLSKCIKLYFTTVSNKKFFKKLLAAINFFNFKLLEIFFSEKVYSCTFYAIPVYYSLYFLINALETENKMHHGKHFRTHHKTTIAKVISAALIYHCKLL